MKQNNWVVFLILLGIFFVSLMGLSLYRAGKDVSRVSDAEYTKHGYEYAITGKELSASKQLGWTVECVKTGSQITVYLRQENGKPVPGATGEIEFIAPDSGIPFLTAKIREIRDGLYAADLPQVKGREVIGHLSIRKAGVLLRKRVMILL